MSNLTGSHWPGAELESVPGPIEAQGKLHRSLAGYWFAEDDAVWVLDKNTKVNQRMVRKLLAKGIQDGYTAALAHFARTLSPGYVQAINSGMLRLLRHTNVSEINTTMLLNYRATLTRDTEPYLGVVRTFFYKWHDLGYLGVDDEVITLLNSWTLRGSIKGDAVKRLDPTEGPFTDNELLAFNEGAARVFEQKRISITDLSMALLVSHTGRRPRQISFVKICDLDGTRKNMKHEPMYLIHIPRTKQTGEIFRESFKVFAMTHELWVVLTAQRDHCIQSVERKLGFSLEPEDRLMLPLFPDLRMFVDVSSVSHLRILLAGDRLHVTSAKVTDTLQRVGKTAMCRSERTGGLLRTGATRFRYTTGTRAAREGFGPMIIAELLDHTDTQNVHVYTKNVPEHVAALDMAVGHQLATHAQAFQGVLIDKEKDGRRGNDPTSRISHNGQNTGTCGSFGFCGANVPIPCYTCMHFQPWVNGPHEMVLTDLIAERDRIFEITGDAAVAAVNDRTVLAVAQVVQSCQSRRSDLIRKKEDEL